MVVAFLFPSPLEVTWVINRNSMIIIDKINVFPSPLEVTWVINPISCIKLQRMTPKSCFIQDLETYLYFTTFFIKLKVSEKQNIFQNFCSFIRVEDDCLFLITNINNYIVSLLLTIKFF